MEGGILLGVELVGGGGEGVAPPTPCKEDNDTVFMPFVNVLKSRKFRDKVEFLSLI